MMVSTSVKHGGLATSVVLESFIAETNKNQKNVSDNLSKKKHLYIISHTIFGMYKPLKPVRRPYIPGEKGQPR